MCGINGIFAYHYAANSIDVDELARTRDQMAPRGPDGAGSWLAFSQAGLLFDPVYPSLSLIAVYLSGSLLSFIKTETDRARVKRARLGCAVPQTVAHAQHCLGVEEQGQQPEDALAATAHRFEQGRIQPKGVTGGDAAHVRRHIPQRDEQPRGFGHFIQNCFFNGGAFIPNRVIAALIEGVQRVMAALVIRGGELGEEQRGGLRAGIAARDPHQAGRGFGRQVV